MTPLSDTRKRRRVDVQPLDRPRLAVAGDDRELAAEAARDVHGDRVVVDPFRLRDRTIDGRGSEVLRRTALDRLQVQIVRLGAVDAGADVGDGASVWRHRDVADRPMRFADRRELSSREVDRVEPFVPAVGLRSVAGHRERAGGRPASTRSGRCASSPSSPASPRATRHRASRCADAASSLSATRLSSLSFSRCCCASGFGSGISSAMWRPSGDQRNAPIGILAIGELLGFAAAHRQAIELRRRRRDPTETRSMRRRATSAATNRSSRKTSAGGTVRSRRRASRVARGAPSP